MLGLERSDHEGVPQAERPERTVMQNHHVTHLVLEFLRGIIDHLVPPHCVALRSKLAGKLLGLGIQPQAGEAALQQGRPWAVDPVRVGAPVVEAPVEPPAGVRPLGADAASRELVALATALATLELPVELLVPCVIRALG